jgi:uncharacterized lipoprotein YmbA
MDRLTFKADRRVIELLLKGLRLVRVYRDKETELITEENTRDAKILGDELAKHLNSMSTDLPRLVDPKCDPDANCDW